MKRMLLSLFLAVLLVAPAVGQCGPGGCPTRQPAPNIDVRIGTNLPTPAWRYERAIGYRAALVRVFCQEDARTRSIGSGTLVRWRGKLVVLTARHVIKGARQIIVELVTRKTHYATVLMVDKTWDCAVLELKGKPMGVRPAEIEFGPRALPGAGERLESCGYGPDGKLAINVGVFKGFRRSTAVMQGPDDWMVISGHARGGDSGGGVFNSRGRLVGVLWGTDSETVVCVQAGRIHKILAAAVPYEQKGIFDRNPTPPLAGPLVPVPPMNQGGDCVGGNCADCPQSGSCDTAANRQQAGSMLPWRNDAEKRDSDLAAGIQALLRAQENERQARLAGQQQGPSVDVQVGPQGPVIDAVPKPSGTGITLCIVGALVCGAFVFYFVQKN